MKQMKGEKHIIDDIDDKITQCISTGDGVDDIANLDNNVDNADK